MQDRSIFIDRLLKSPQSRESYIRSKLNVLIPSQIRGLRLRRSMIQTELAKETGMKQSRVSAMERPGQVQFNVETLIRLAAAFKVGLVVKFASFSEMLSWENSYSQDRFDVTQIDDDAEFMSPAVPTDQRGLEANKAVGAEGLCQPDIGNVAWLQHARMEEVPQKPPETMGTAKSLSGMQGGAIRQPYPVQDGESR